MRIRRLKLLLVKILTHVIAWIIAFAWILPFMGIFMASIRPMEEIIAGWWRFDSFHVTLSNFIEAWHHPSVPMSRGIINSLIVTIPSSIIPLIVGALAAYGFSRFSFPLKEMLFLTIVTFMALPPQAIGIPLFILMNQLGLVDTYVGLVLFHSANGLPWIILFLRNYFETVPKELEDAARVDGASEIQIFLGIILPVIKPALYSILALQFTWVWSDFFYALILIYTPDNLLASQRIPLMKGEYHIPWGTLCAASIIMISVPAILYAFLQKYFIRGIVGGVIKG